MRQVRVLIVCGMLISGLWSAQSAALAQEPNACRALAQEGIAAAARAVALRARIRLVTGIRASRRAALRASR